MKFKAKEIFVGYDENDVLIIGFSENSTEHEKPIYFMLQDSKEYGDQDKQLGMDTYYIEKNDQSMGGYGGIAEVYLERNRIKIELDKNGIDNVKENFVEIVFECGDNEFKNLLKRLDQIFSNGELKTNYNTL